MLMDFDILSISILRLLVPSRSRRSTKVVIIVIIPVVSVGP